MPPTSTPTKPETQAPHLLPAAALVSFISIVPSSAAGLPQGDAAGRGRADGGGGSGSARMPMACVPAAAIYPPDRGRGGQPDPGHPRWIRTAPATALVDGDNGMGHLVMSRAAEIAIDLAREAGIGWVGVRRSNHAGPASLYAAMPVAHGMVGIYSAVASANHMAPWGGLESLLGTNPLAIGIPTGDAPPVILDIATTVVSYGTVKNYTLQGKAMPEGWMIDRSTGSPLTDSARSTEGVLLPIGGYKGAGLALMLGLLAGTRLMARQWAAMWSISTPTIAARPIPATSSWHWTSPASSIRRYSWPP